MCLVSLHTYCKKTIYLSVYNSPNKFDISSYHLGLFFSESHGGETIFPFCLMFLYKNIFCNMYYKISSRKNLKWKNHKNICLQISHAHIHPLNMSFSYLFCYAAWISKFKHLFTEYLELNTYHNHQTFVSSHTLQELHF